MYSNTATVSLLKYSLTLAESKLKNREHRTKVKWSDRCDSSGLSQSINTQCLECSDFTFTVCKMHECRIRKMIISSLSVFRSTHYKCTFTQWVVYLDIVLLKKEMQKEPQKGEH